MSLHDRTSHAKVLNEGKVGVRLPVMGVKSDHMNCFCFFFFTLHPVTLLYAYYCPFNTYEKKQTQQEIVSLY